MIRSLASADKGRCRDMTIQPINSTGSRSRKAAGGLKAGLPPCAVMRMVVFSLW